MVQLDVVVIRLGRGTHPWQVTWRSRSLKFSRGPFEGTERSAANWNSRDAGIACHFIKNNKRKTSVILLQDGLTRNDDRILATCLSLCKAGNKDQANAGTVAYFSLRRERYSEHVSSVSSTLWWWLIPRLADCNARAGRGLTVIGVDSAKTRLVR